MRSDGRSDAQRGENLLDRLREHRPGGVLLDWSEHQVWVLTAGQNARVGRDAVAHVAHHRSLGLPLDSVSNPWGLGPAGWFDGLNARSP